MKRFKKLLLVIDPKIKTQAAIDHAVSLAKENTARITVLSVVNEIPLEVSMAIIAMPPQELMATMIKERQTQLDELVASMRQQGIEADAKVLSGTPFLEIIRHVLREHNDLVIITAEGKSGLTERLFGSTSMHLMRKCPCPVWVVKASRRKKYQRILAAVDTTSDFPDPEQESLNPLNLQLAGSVVKTHKSVLHVVQVCSVYGEGYMSVRGGVSDKLINKLRSFARQQYTAQVNKLLAAVDLEGVTVEKHLPRSTDIAKSIVSLAKSQKIGLLVMGTVCRTGVTGFLIGNTAEKVMNKVDCSVLTVKPEGFVTPVTL